MIISFKSKATHDIYDGVSSRDARQFPTTIWRVAQRKLDMLNAAVVLSDLKVPPGNRLHPLQGDKKGHYSISINDQFRIIFQFRDCNAYEVEITDYH